MTVIGRPPNKVVVPIKGLVVLEFEVVFTSSPRGLKLVVTVCNAGDSNHTSYSTNKDPFYAVLLEQPVDITNKAATSNVFKSYYPVGREFLSVLCLVKI